MNQVTLIGRICRDVEAKQIGKSYVLKTAVAVDREFSGKDGNKETDFIDIEVWVPETSYAKYHQKYTLKGALISLQGSIKVDTYKNKDGENRKSIRVSSQNKLNVLRGPKNSHELATEPPGFSPEGAGFNFDEIDDYDDNDMF